MASGQSSSASAAQQAGTQKRAIKHTKIKVSRSACRYQAQSPLTGFFSMFKIDRQNLILTLNKYISYLINIAIVAVIVGGIVFWIQILIESAK